MSIYRRVHFTLCDLEICRIAWLPLLSTSWRGTSGKLGRDRHFSTAGIEIISAMTEPTRDFGGESGKKFHCPSLRTIWPRFLAAGSDHDTRPYYLVVLFARAIST